MNALMKQTRQLTIAFLVAIAASAVPVASAATTPVYRFYYEPIPVQQQMVRQAKEAQLEIVGQARVDTLLSAHDNLRASADQLSQSNLVAVTPTRVDLLAATGLTNNSSPNQLIGGAGNAFGRTYQVDFQVHVVHKVRNFNRY